MYYVCKLILWMALHIGFSLKYEGRENIPEDRNVVYTSNHRSYADPPILGVGAKGRCSFVAKEELFRHKLFAILIKSLGAIPVSRGKGDNRMFEMASERIARGDSLIIFPEGTRSKSGKILRGHAGAALIAAKTGKDIVPVAIVFSGRLRFRSRVTVRYGQPIITADYCKNSEEPDPRELVELKKRYMEEITRLAEGGQTNGGEKENG